MTSDELRVTGEERLTPAMRRWVGLLERGYTIRRYIQRSTYRGTVWAAGLYNPDGLFVQRVRSDTARKLARLGVLGEEGRMRHGDSGADGGAGGGAE